MLLLSPGWTGRDFLIVYLRISVLRRLNVRAPQSHYPAYRLQHISIVLAGTHGSNDIAVFDGSSQVVWSAVSTYPSCYKNKTADQHRPAFRFWNSACRKMIQSTG